MLKPRWLRILSFVVALAVLWSLSGRPDSVLASYTPEDKKPPERIIRVNVSYIRHDWLLIGEKSAKILCLVSNDREITPTAGDILNSCGKDVYYTWRTSDENYYFQWLSATPSKKVVERVVPKPAVWLSLSGCEPEMPESTCRQIPMLVLSGEEQFPDQKISAIHIVRNGKETVCFKSICRLALYDTGEQGTRLEFWADSSLGDSSDTFHALVRVVPSQKKMSGGAKSWVVNVVSSQTVGLVPPGCSLVWDSLPPSAGLPDWLSTPADEQALSSQVPYTYLAANLLAQGVVKAPGCTNGGLQVDGTASQCGLEKARPALLEWQNRFDRAILDAAHRTGVPARLLKNVFARESQFWPGGILDGPLEVGFGHLTEIGSDTTFRWNQAFFKDFCPWVLDKSSCLLGYDNLAETDITRLKRALLDQADLTCRDCTGGVKPEKIDFGVRIFAETLLANCNQTGQVLSEITGRPPALLASYDELWKLTLLNYHSGVGCMMRAVQAGMKNGEPVQWNNISKYLEPVCKSSIPYIYDISK
jgi:hypothetical protein